MSFRRRIASHLMDHACAVVPPGRSDWAKAMRAEFVGISNASEALRWASGCVWASYVARINPMDVFVKSLIRATVLWLVVFAGFAIPMMINPHKYLGAVYLQQAAHKLPIYYAVIFLLLWIGELLIARFWSSSKGIVEKSLVRAAALWLPLFLLRFITVLLFHAQHPASHLLWGRFLAGAALWFSIFYVAVFIPLLLCELLLSRFWFSRPKLQQ